MSELVEYDYSNFVPLLVLLYFNFTILELATFILEMKNLRLSERV